MELEFKPNLEVVNPACPQWGVGRILLVEPGSGGKGQRVRVNFDGVGVKTMMIPPGRLVLPDSSGKPPSQAVDGQVDEAMAERLQAIPEVIGDPRAGMEVRLGELIGLYRFSDDRRDIFDWAVSQLGQKDPLENFTADELGLYFSNFCRSRDRALHSFYREVRQAGLEDQFLAELKRKASEKSYRLMSEVLAGGR